MKYNHSAVFRARVKVCGITSLSDGLAAVEAGADALGFNFYEKSPRFVTLAKAAGIVRALPPLVGVVGLFVEPTLDFMRRAIGCCRLDAFQMHGQVGEDFLGLFPRDKVIRAFALRGRRDLKKLGSARFAGACLVDAYAEGKHGGTGRKLDLGLAAAARRILKKPMILAGGLTADNVAEAILKARPYGVDVCTGVESAPGRKDFEKMVRFVRCAKSVAIRGPMQGQ